jgi:hypothetical protein
MADATHALASLAVEFWKLAANFERQVEHGDDARKAGGHAQLRYSRRRLETLLEADGMRVVFYDGEQWSAVLPASAVNAEDVADIDNLTVETTLEPTIVGPDGVIIPGKVILKGEL